MPAKKTATKRTTAKKTTAKKVATKSSARKRTSPAAKKKATPAKGRTKTANTSKRTKAGDREVTIDRRRQPDRRTEDKEAPSKSPAATKLERREKVQRRRQIDPTTCERDYSVEEVEFMNAMDEYKRKNGRMFPTCSEVLEVIRDLGYVRLTSAELATLRPAPAAEPATDVGAAPEVADEEDEVAVALEPVGAAGGGF